MTKTDSTEPEHGKCPSCGHCKCCEASTIAEIVAKVMEKVPVYPVPYYFPAPSHNYGGSLCWCGMIHNYTWTSWTPTYQYFPVVANAAAAVPAMTTYQFTTGGPYGISKDSGTTPGAPLHEEGSSDSTLAGA